jgi:hypothetical protein
MDINRDMGRFPVVRFNHGMPVLFRGICRGKEIGGGITRVSGNRDTIFIYDVLFHLIENLEPFY